MNSGTEEKADNKIIQFPTLKQRRISLVVKNKVSDLLSCNNNVSKFSAYFEPQLTNRAHDVLEFISSQYFSINTEKGDPMNSILYKISDIKGKYFEHAPRMNRRDCIELWHELDATYSGLGTYEENLYINIVKILLLKNAN